MPATDNCRYATPPASAISEPAEYLSSTLTLSAALRDFSNPGQVGQELCVFNIPAQQVQYYGQTRDSRTELKNEGLAPGKYYFLLRNSRRKFILE